MSQELQQKIVTAINHDKKQNKIYSYWKKGLTVKRFILAKEHVKDATGLQKYVLNRKSH
jgi:exopolysaccharide biosynthesis predicted pyruvyltransferase EpsI